MIKSVGIVIATWLITFAAFAQESVLPVEEPTWRLRALGGLAFPVADKKFSDFHFKGLCAGGGIHHKVSRIFSFGAYFRYNNFDLSTDRFIEGYENDSFKFYQLVEGGELNVYQAGLDVKIYPPLNNLFNPYVIFQPALYFLHKNSINGDHFIHGKGEMAAPVDETGFGVAIGIGGEYQVSDFLGVFSQVKYHYLPEGIDQYSSIGFIPVEIGIQYYF